MALRDTLQDQLGDALRARDRPATSALRTALAALANAEALPAPEVSAPASGSEHVAGATPGLAATEAPRLALAESAARDLVGRERDDLLRRARTMATLGREREAGEAERGAAALQRALVLG